MSHNKRLLSGKALSVFLSLCIVMSALSGITLFSASAVTAVDYIDKNGDTKSCSSYTSMSSSTTTLSDDTWYVVDSSVTVSSRIVVSGTAYLILKDGCTLTASKGINVPEGTSLTIYGQSGGTGKITASASDGNAAIGGNKAENNGTITINGGTINATGPDRAAAIGAGNNVNNSRQTDIVGEININGGTITATGGVAAAAIGGGTYFRGGNINITGGTITANGGNSSAAIGAGDNCACGDIVITGGYFTLTRVTTWGTGEYIGKANDYSNSGASYIGSVTITGGYFANGDASDSTVYEVSVASGYSVIDSGNTTYPYLVTDTSASGYNDFVIAGGEDYTYTSHVLTINGSGTYTISMNTAYSVTSTTTDRIVIASDATVTLNGLNITSSSDSPIEISDDKTVTLILSGSNVLKTTAENYAGLRIYDGTSLTIRSVSNDDTSGSLNVTGGVQTDSNGGAGIGSNYGEDSGSITINSGTITALGGWNSAGIGGGYKGSSTSIEINGGIVNATSTASAAGIGGGTSGNGGSITINDGTVTATSGTNGAGIGAGRTLSSGDLTSGGTILITGGTINAKSTSNGAAIGGGYGDKINSATAASGDITITGGYFTLASGSSKYIGAGAGSYTSTGTISITGGYFVVGDTTEGTVYTTKVADGYVVNASGITEYPYKVTSSFANKDFAVTGDKSFTYIDELLTITGGTECTISMNTADNITSTTTDRIVVNSSSDVTITIVDLDVTTTDNSPISITGSGTVTLKLSGDSTLTSYSSSSSYAGLQVNEGHSLIITSADGDGETSGSLTAKSTTSANTVAGGAGIGGNINNACGTVTIKGGTVTATGAGGGAGIGGGRSGTGGTINISGGVVTATGSTYQSSGTRGSAGIGGGAEKAGGTINISGGIVTASSVRTGTSQRGGAGIGGGYNGGSGTIIISDGTITASGYCLAAGIGAGAESNSVNITISGGYILTSSTLAYVGGTQGSSIGDGEGGTSGTYNITGGYFGDGSVDDNLAYKVTPASDYSVVYNTESTKAAYPYLVLASSNAVSINLYLANGTFASNISNTITMKYSKNATVDLPADSDEFTFSGNVTFIVDGWYTSDAYTGTSVTQIKTSELSGSEISLYARLLSAPAYTVTIPSEAELGNTAQITAENVTLGDDYSLVVRLTETSETDNSLKLRSSRGTGTDSIAYSLTVNDGTPITTANNDVILQIDGRVANKSLTSSNLSFSAPTNTAKYVGEYSGTLTFTVSIDTQ